MSISLSVRAPVRVVRAVLGLGLACGAGITCGGDGTGPATTVGINSSARSVGFSVAPGGTVDPKSISVTPTTGQLTGLKAQITYVSPSGPAWLDASFATTTATVDAPGVLTLRVTQSDLPPGTYTASVTVSADNGANTPKIQVSFIVEAASALVLITQPSSTATSGAPLAQAPVVGLQSASGVSVAQGGVVISVSLEGGGTLAGPASATTDAQGEATFDGLSITALAGEQTLLFTSPALTEVRSNPVTITSGTAAILAASSVTTQSAEAGQLVNEPPVALVTDAAGNPIAGVVVTFAVTGGGGVISPTSPVTTTGAGLAALASWQLGATAGANSVSATAAGLTGSPLQFSATGTNGGVVPGPISQSNSSVSASPATFAAGSSGTTITVTARDAGNNLISGATVSLSSSGTNFVFGNTSLTTGTTGSTLGKATTTYTSTKAEVKSITAQITAAGVTVTPTAASVTVTPGAPSAAMSTVTATSPPPGLANSSTVTVTVKDANGNPVGGRAVTLAFVSGSGGTIVQPSSTTNPTTGVTQGSISSSTGGTYQVSATVSGTPSTVISQTASITFLLSFAADIEPLFTVGHPNADPNGPATTSACSSCHLPYVTNGTVPDLSFAHITDVHDAGNVVVTGNPDASLLIKALEHDASLQATELMPATDQRLSPALIQLIRQWIAQDPTTLRP